MCAPTLTGYTHTYICIYTLYTLTPTCMHTNTGARGEEGNLCNIYLKQTCFIFMLRLLSVNLTFLNII